MPSYQEIYDAHATEYDELVRHEDARGNVARFLRQALAERPQRVVELGCGTGRVTRLLAPLASEVRAYDGAAHMIEFAKRALPLPHVTFGVADNANLPEPSGEADLVVACWTLGHLTGFYPDHWREHAKLALHEMRRLARKGGRLLVLETLGTCVDTPAPPNPRLADFYTMMEDDFALARTTIATDYEFPSALDAERIMGFFFGPKMAAAVKTRHTPTVPEWTGAWTGPA